MGIETNLNQSPYFDDFNENKNFHRVLFRPGYAVQARELTQLQTILQNQIERFANEVLVDGTIVSGCGVKVNGIDFVKLRDKDANNRVMLLGDFYSGGVVANAVITGATTGITAQLIDVAEGSEIAAPNYLTLFVDYTNAGSNNTVKTFANNEVLLVRQRSNSEFIVAANTITANACGLGLRATVSDGIIYHKGNFIRVSPQGTIVEKYGTKPTKALGFETRETLIDSNQDSSLLDNASGSTNFSAPGANRLKLTPTLAVRPQNTANTTTFFTIANIEDGIITQKFTDTTYSDIGQYIAQRNYETSGNYAVEPFNIRIREHLKTGSNLGRYAAGTGDNTKLVAEVEKGIGYVNGNRVSIESAVFRTFDKATDYEVKDARVIGQAIGHYVIVNDVVGTWDFQGLRTVTLYDSAQNGVTGLNYGTESASGSSVGTAKIRGIQYQSGTPGTPTARFRIYLFDIQMNSGKSFDFDVKGLYINNTSGPKSMADVLVVNGKRLQEAGLNSLVFPFSQSGTKTLKDAANNVDTQFVFRTEKTVNFSTAGTATVSANTAHAGGTETLNDTGSPLTTADERNVLVVAKAAVSTSPMAGYIANTSGTTITGVGTDFDAQYQVGDLITIVDSPEETARVVSITNDALMTVAQTLSTRTGVTLGHKKSFPTGYMFDLAANGTINSSSTQYTIDLGQANLASTFTASVYFNVLRSDAVQTTKTVNKDKYVHINTGSHSASDSGPWSLGVSDVFKIQNVYLGTNTTVTSSDTDVTTHFELDTGMKDGFYDTSYLKKKATSSLDTTNKGLLIKLSYFGRDRSAGIGFLSVDSYPIDDANTANSSAITTSEIPLFRSPRTGRYYDLRDSIDFRPIRQNTITPSANAVAVQTPSITNPDANTSFNIDSDGAYCPTPDENFQTDIQFYLPRRDRIVITSEGNIDVIKGVPSLNPKAPEERAGSMTLATLDIPVYPSLSPFVSRQNSRPEYQVRLTLENNRRYTMRDLRTIDQRVKNLEYYSSLNYLESSARNKQLFNDSGLDRFKNGFLVDNFDGHNLADTSKVGYRAAIDRNNTVLRPSFTRSDIGFTKDLSLTSTNLTQNGNVITLSYTDALLLNQRFASKQRNCVQELQFNWKGEVILNPSMDNTPDITTLPDIQVDFDGMYNAIEELARSTGVTVGTDWGRWRTVDSSSTTDTSVATDVDRNRTWNAITTTTTTTTTAVTTTQTDQIRNGIQTSISPSNETFSIGNFVENVAVRDYIRSRNLQVTGVRMKPNTRVYPYFDDELVTGYVTPANSSFANTAAEGSSLVTDSSGTIYANFRIPNDDNLKFRIGTKRFEFKDVANTQTQSSLVTTSAHGDFTSIPLDITQRGSSVNLVVPQFSKRRVTDNRTLTSVVTNTTVDQRVEREEIEERGSGNEDPIAQTFTVSVGQSEGVFITKMNLFFAKKSSTYPVTVQIREVENGFPTDTIVPFGSKTLQPSEVSANASSSTTATTFTFDAPVFLKNNTDYCFVTIPGGNTDEYVLWVGELGGTDVATNELIRKQPSSGIMFTSANDKTWSPIQSEDIKFQLYRAEFTTSAATLYMENDEIEYVSYSTISGTFKVGEKVTWTGGRGFFRFIDTERQVIHIERSNGSLSPGTITGSVSGATATVSSVDNLVMNSLVSKVPQITYANTSVSWAARTTSTSGVINPSFVDVDLGIETNFIDGEKKVYSKSNETALSAVNGSKKSLILRGTFSTTDTKVSPVFDVSRINGLILENVINNDTTDEHKDVGSASVRYITRPVELTDGNEAEDLKVFLTAYKPSGTNVSVYARIHNPEDAEDFDTKDFTPLTQITSSNVYSDSVNTRDFKEFEFGFSANTDGQGFLTTANSHARLNSSNNEVVTYRSSDGSIHSTYKTFAIKIVLTSDGTNVVPLVNDMRAIALQK